MAYKFFVGVLLGREKFVPGYGIEPILSVSHPLIVFSWYAWSIYPKQTLYASILKTTLPGSIPLAANEYYRKKFVGLDSGILANQVKWHWLSLKFSNLKYSWST